jgi:hypothetical protein
MKCFFHKWTKWTIEGVTDKGWPIQVRDCKKCGITQSRKI